MENMEHKQAGMPGEARTERAHGVYTPPANYRGPAGRVDPGDLARYLPGRHWAALRREILTRHGAAPAPATTTGAAR